MSLQPKEVATLAILAQSPKRYGHIVKTLSGTARRIGEAMVKPRASTGGKIKGAAKDIRTWADNNKRLSARLVK